MEEGRSLIDEFQAQMYKKLKNSVRGYVRFNYNPDTDTYKLTISRKGVVFRYKIDNVTDALMHGETTDNYITSILKMYSNVIHNKIFFRDKREDKTLCR